MSLNVPDQWPDWAVYGVEFGQGVAFDDYGLPIGGTHFFKCAADLIRWVRGKRLYAAVTGVAIDATVYKWDLGPQVVFSRSLQG